MDGIAGEQFPFAEQQFSECLGRQFSDEERTKMYNGMRNALYGVVESFARE